MIRREDLLLKVNAQDGDLEPAAGYSVVATKYGAVCSGSSVIAGDTTFPVYAGHGFTTGDRLIVNLDEGTFVTVSSTTSTTVVTNGAIAAVAGDILINLGADSGVGTPNYDHADDYTAIYSVPSTSATQIADSTVTVSVNGEYAYWHNTTFDIWELILDTSGTPVDIRLAANSGALDGADSSTDNAVARFDGTGGKALQNSVVTIGDTGEVAGVSTLATTGAITGGSTIASTTTLTAGTSLSVTTSATIGTTLGVTGATTLSSTLGVTGATTLSSTLGVTGAATLSSTLGVSGAVTLSSTLAVTGTVTTTTHLTVGGQLRRSVTTGITASTTHTQVGATALTADVNEVSTCANASDAVSLPTAVAGMVVHIINNGAAALAIWPASGDNAGSGVDTVHSSTLAAGSNRTYIAYNTTNWETF